MQMTRIDDLAYGIDGDYIDLEQDSGCGEMSMIRLHRIHLAHLVELAGVVTTDRSAEQTIRTLQRRLLTLAREIRSLAEWVRSGPDEGEAGFPDFLQVMALDTLAEALIDDLPGAPVCSTDQRAINLIGAGNQLDCSKATEPKPGPLIKSGSGTAPTTGQLFAALDEPHPSQIGTSPESGLAALDAGEVSCN